MGNLLPALSHEQSVGRNCVVFAVSRWVVKEKGVINHPFLSRVLFLVNLIDTGWGVDARALIT